MVLLVSVVVVAGVDAASRCGDVAPDRAAADGEQLTAEDGKAAAAAPATLRATVVRTSFTFPVPGRAALEIRRRRRGCRFPLTTQSRTTRSALPTRMPPPSPVTSRCGRSDP